MRARIDFRACRTISVESSTSVYKVIYDSTPTKVGRVVGPVLCRRPFDRRRQLPTAFISGIMQTIGPPRRQA